MLRVIMTLAVGFALLVGVGAWFDPEGAREAIRRDLSGLAGRAVERAGDAVRTVVEEAVEKAKPSPAAAPGEAIRAEAPDRTPGPLAAGPRTEKKPPPVVAAASPRAEEQPQVQALEVEVVDFAAPAEFLEAPLEPERAAAPPDATLGAPERADLEMTQRSGDPRDVGAAGVLIRRMLALYERMSATR